MTDRPIIFSAPMVIALLDGRKTQTRRLATSPLRRCAPGDRLWVRETWARDDLIDTGARYYATDAINNLRKKRPSIHMPRWASRLTLIVEAVRVQRLHDITLDDELAEGAPIDPNYRDTSRDGSGPPMVLIGCAQWITPRAWYHRLWDALHGADSWAANPEVVAITFRVVRGNIDRIAA